MIGPKTFAATAVSWWHCIPCGTTNNDEAFCCICGRDRKAATDPARWSFTLDAEIAADDEECPHDHVEKDDDGRDNWFYVCSDCDQTVVLTPPDEDGHSYWEVFP